MSERFGHSQHGLLFAVLVLAIVVSVAALLGGCAEASPVERVAEVMPAKVLQERLNVAQHELAAEKQATLTEHQAAAAADRRVAEAKGILMQAQAEAKTAHENEDKAIEAARLAPIRATITMCEIVCVIAAGLGVVAAVVIWYLKIPWGWRIPAGFAAGFAIAFVALVIFGTLLTHLAALGWGCAVLVALASIAWAVWGLWDKIRTWKVTHEITRVSDEALEQLEARGHGELAQAIKAKAAGRQLRGGIQHLVARSLAVSKQRVQWLQAGG